MGYGLGMIRAGLVESDTRADSLLLMKKGWRKKIDFFNEIKSICLIQTQMLLLLPLLLPLLLLLLLLLLLMLLPRRR